MITFLLFCLICIGFLLIKEFGRRFLLCYNVISGSAPPYLSDLLQLYIPSRTLRSSADTQTFRVPHWCKKFQGCAPFLTLVLSPGTVFPLPSAMLRLFLLLNPNSRLSFSVNPSSITCLWPFHLLPWCGLRGWLGIINLFIYVCVRLCMHAFACLICTTLHLGLCHFLCVMSVWMWIVTWWFNHLSSLQFEALYGGSIFVLLVI